MKILLLFAPLLLLPQEKNEAEALYKKMEEKLVKAKTFQVKSTASASMKDGKMTMESRIHTSGENSLRMDVEIDMPMGATKMSAVSDGKALVFTGPHPVKSNAPPKTLNADLMPCFARGGALFCMGWVDAWADKEDRRPVRRQVPEVKSFKMGRREKVEGREAQGIECLLSRVESGADITTIIWIDSESGLPLKREMQGKHGQEDMALVEVYSDLKLDEKIDASKFELPKETK